MAKHLSEDSYGLIFGTNTFFALLLQSLLTLIVVEKDALALGIRSQVEYILSHVDIILFLQLARLMLLI